MMNEPTMENSSPEETPRSDQFNLGYNCKQEKANFCYVQQNTKERVLGVHLSAGPQMCPDFKMERDMNVANSQLME